jgi:hypothetical protein
MQKMHLRVLRRGPLVEGVVGVELIAVIGAALVLPIVGIILV